MANDGDIVTLAVPDDFSTLKDAIKDGLTHCRKAGLAEDCKLFCSFGVTQGIRFFLVRHLQTACELGSKPRRAKGSLATGLGASTRLEHCA